jgi:hypothetical protein
MFQKLTAAAMSILLLLTPSFAVNHRAPSALQQGVTIANVELLKQAPTAKQMFDLSDSIEKFAAKSQADGTFTAAESWITQNSAAIISGQYNDVGPAYSELATVGYTGTQEQFQKIVSHLTNSQRKTLVESVQKQGLYKYSLSIAAEAHSIGLSIRNHTKLQGVQPLDGDCAAMADLGNQIMALGAIVAFFNPLAGADIAAIGALIFFYAEWICPYESQ